jgi:hypothetical protein
MTPTPATRIRRTACPVGACPTPATRVTRTPVAHSNPADDLPSASACTPTGRLILAVRSNPTGERSAAVVEGCTPVSCPTPVVGCYRGGVR